MLKDPRVDITLSDHRGHTPLWHASFGGSVDVVEWLIASGRELGDLSIVSSSYLNEDIGLLLEKFMVNPAQIRHELQVKLGVLDEFAAEIFALTVFLCDGLLQLRPPTLITSSSNPAAVRFFTIAKRLPMELQMILCHRAVGSMKQNILHKDSEAAFKSLARILLLPQSE